MIRKAYQKQDKSFALYDAVPVTMSALAMLST